MSTRAPERIGSYRLIKAIGQGKTCQVWEVERGMDNERMAMKLLLPGNHYTKQNITALKHEYNVARSLDHPHVIRAEHYSSDACQTYVILQLFRSANLKTLIHQGVENIAHLSDEIVRGAAGGLAYLHGEGWIHRDVKPDNFLVSGSGEVKLIDFSIAQRRKGKLGRLFSKSSQLQGTQSYMSPEQIRGGATDERSDIYSFGCVLYELVTGKTPYTGFTPSELLNKHLRSRTPSLAAAGLNVTRPFAELVERMMSKNADDRPASMDEFLKAFAEMHVYYPQGRTA